MPSILFKKGATRLRSFTFTIQHHTRLKNYQPTVSKLHSNTAPRQATTKTHAPKTTRESNKRLDCHVGGCQAHTHTHLPPPLPDTTLTQHTQHARFPSAKAQYSNSSSDLHLALVSYLPHPPPSRSLSTILLVDNTTTRNSYSKTRYSATKQHPPLPLSSFPLYAPSTP